MVVSWYRKANAKIKRIAELIEPAVPFILYTVIAVYLGAILIFAAVKTVFEENWWMQFAYYVCQDIAGTGFLVWLLIYLSAKPYRGLIFPVLILSLIIFLWDVISYLTGWGANHPIATGIIFGIGAIIVLIFMIKDTVCHLRS